MQNLSHTTVNSFPGRTGNCYWASFDPHRKAIGRTTDIYKGRFNGKGPLMGEFATVKKPRGLTGTSAWCDVQIAKNRKAYEMARGFHKFIDSKNIVRFTDSWKVLMDEAARFSSRLSSDEWLIIEEFLGSKLHSFVDPEGRVNYGNCEVLEAFVHWTCMASNGSLVISNLEGVMSPTPGKNQSAFCLKTPTIHSVDRVYGFSDKGFSGITEVLRHHHCNAICKNWSISRGETSMLCRSHSIYSDSPPPYYSAVS